MLRQQGDFVLGRAVRVGPGWRGAAVAAAAVACALPLRAGAYDSVPLPSMLPSPEPEDGRRLWVGARAHRDWERFEITLSDGTPYARRSPSGRLAGEVGLRLGPRLSTSVELTSTGIGTAVQLDFVETAAAKVAAVVQADLRAKGPQGSAGAGIAVSGATAPAGLRLVPFVRLDAHVARVRLGRGGSGDDGPYGSATRWETAIVSSAGLALPLRRLELAIAGGWRAVVRAGAFDEIRPADPRRRAGAYAMASARWVTPLRGEAP